MPFTPFHFGPGLFIKSIVRKYFSFTVFAFSQVIIDSEVLYYMATGQWVVHRFFHSYIGATVVAGLSVVIGRPICQFCIRIWNRHSGVTRGSWLYIQPRIPLLAVIIAAVVGSFSHVLFDSFLYSDMRPLAPFAEGNSLYGVLSMRIVYLGCVVSAIAGFGIFTVRIVFKKRQKKCQKELDGIRGTVSNSQITN